MEGKFLTSLKNEFNFTSTENGALTHKTTNSAVYDLFSLGGAMRNRSKEDKILLFKKAVDEDEVLALRCLFYLRDVREGQGEREFFRTCFHWYADNNSLSSEKMLELIQIIPIYGRWDDLYCLVDTSYENLMFSFMRQQFILDCSCKTVSLLSKWMKSENASSKETKYLAEKTRTALGLTPKKYRVLLSKNRKKIRIVETLMSQNQWDKIEFDKIPSRAGFKYRNAFARNDITREKYLAFIKSKTTKVNAKNLYPYEVVAEAKEMMYKNDEIERIVINRYWDNLTDYFNKKELSGIAVIDTSASMYGTPLDVACSLGMYMAERNKGIFHNHYISFSRNPKLVEFKGVDFVDKVKRIYGQNLCENTNIEKVFDLFLSLIVKNEILPADLPKNIFIISDMEFDRACNIPSSLYGTNPRKTLMESIKSKWESFGLCLPHLIFWNVDARQNNIPMKDDGNVTYVSGFSPIIFEMVMSGKSGYELMLEKLLSKRYSGILDYKGENLL